MFYDFWCYGSCNIFSSLLEQGLADQDSEELILLIKSTSMTQDKLLNESSKYKDPNLGLSNSLSRSKNIKVPCE